jgi:hypothetical protein
MSIASLVVPPPEQVSSGKSGFQEAWDRIPAPICFAKLFRMASDGGDLISLRERVIAEAAIQLRGCRAALMSLCTIDQLLGDQASGLAYQAEALGLHRLYRSSWTTSPDALRVLAFKAAGDFSTNTPIEFLLEGSDVILYSVYVVPGQSLPSAARSRRCNFHGGRIGSGPARHADDRTVDPNLAVPGAEPARPGHAAVARKPASPDAGHSGPPRAPGRSHEPGRVEKTQTASRSSRALSARMPDEVWRSLTPPRPWMPGWNCSRCGVFRLAVCRLPQRRRAVSQVPHRLGRWPALPLPYGDRRSLGRVVLQRRHGDRPGEANGRRAFHFHFRRGLHAVTPQRSRQ